MAARAAVAESTAVPESPNAPASAEPENATLNTARITNTPTRAISAATTALAAPPAHSRPASMRGTGGSMPRRSALPVSSSEPAMRALPSSWWGAIIAPRRTASFVRCLRARAIPGATQHPGDERGRHDAHPAHTEPEPVVAGRVGKGAGDVRGDEPGEVAQRVDQPDPGRRRGPGEVRG